MFFQFEQDFIESLRCIPMVVRFKLDLCGVKLKLDHWQQFTATEKETFVQLPCGSEAEARHYRQRLQDLILAKTGAIAKELPIDPQPPWAQREAIPSQLQAQLQKYEFTLTLSQWQALTPLQRFVLIKLSAPKHENRNFPQAMAEFGLISQGDRPSI